MPIYDYVCSNCGHAVEVVHSVHGHGPSACPQCGGTMRKAFSPPAVHFKGTGWARKERAGASRKRDTNEAAPGGSDRSSDGGSPESGSKEPSSSTGAPKDQAAARKSSSANEAS